MRTTRWPIAIPMALLLLGANAFGSAVRDEAKMFSERTVELAQAHLDRLERSTNIPVVIETIEHVPGLAKGASPREKREAINEVAKRRDSQIRDEGIYILISRDDRLISQPLVRARLEGIVPEGRRDAIREAFIEEFKREEYDTGLVKGVSMIEKVLEGHKVATPHVGGRAGAAPPIGAGARRGHVGGGSGVFGTFLLIGLGILAVLILLRVLGGLFGRSAGAGYPGQMGGMGGPRPGMGPGGYYGGGPGYGGRGGGFFSGLLGGLGGAIAGNWLYDQMSGRHGGGMTSAGAGYPVDETSLPDQGDDAIIGAEDHGGQGGSWDDGGTDSGGGDWGGGGDVGGDWGGGGGDWGGGGGGGDW